MSRQNFTADSPETAMNRMINAYRTTQMIYVAAKLGIADMLDRGPKSADELAAASGAHTGAHTGALYRLLRALAGLGIFAEKQDGRFGMTPAAGLLRTDNPDSLSPFVLSYGEPWWWSAWGGLLHSVQTGEAAFDYVHGENIFDYLGRDEKASAVFNANMTAMTKREAAAVVEVYDFSGVRTIVDVGGGHGALAEAILKRNPHTRAILFDRAPVIEGARKLLEEEGIAERCQLVPGDFFGAIPGGGDVILLKDILHDWDDDRAIDILRNCRDAMTDTGRLLVIDRIIPAGSEPSVSKQIDINMLVMTGGKERTEAEFRTLLDKPGFELGRVWPTSCGTSIIEAAPR